MVNKTYTIDQLNAAALSYFDDDSLAASVWINKYALKEDGEYIELSPKDTIIRVAKEIHKTELKFKNPLSYAKILSHLEKFKTFIFGGSIQFGLGNNSQISSLGNCFFIDNGVDSYGGLFNMDETMAQLMKRRGGVGITIENLRPATASVNNSAQSSTGATSFMDRFSNTTREVAQDGRRGALMISMLVNHPDISSFIEKKDDLTKVTGANVSIKVTDEFMETVEKDGDYILSWPTLMTQPKVDKTLNYDKLYKNSDGSYVMKVKAAKIWDKLVYQAHKNAEPGVLFWDNIINESPADCYHKDGFITKGTNPCGEVPLSPYDSCRLGSLNLSNMVINPYQKNARIDWDLVVETSRFAQRVMDDVVTLEEEKVNAIIEKIDSDPEPPHLKAVELKTWQTVLDVLQKGRRTGIGVLGLGDMLAKLGIKYGSKEATKLIDTLHETIAVNVYKETINLAKERGSFPIWDFVTESDNPFIRRVTGKLSNDEYDDFVYYGRRNIASLSIAPTGTLALEAMTTSGIEPVFKIRSKRRKKVNPNDPNARVDFVDENGDSWEEYNVFHYEFLKWFGSDEEHKQFTPRQIEELLQGLSEDELDEIISTSPWAGSESHDIDYMEKINMQGVIQKWIDHSISVTHNVPKDISLKEVNDIYFQAWKAGCKGCTIYREGSRTGVLLTGKEDKKDEIFPESNAPKRPKELVADYYIAKANGKEFCLMIGLWPGTNRPYEVFGFENPPESKNTTGKLVKVKKGQYKFVNGDFEIENVQLAADNIEQRMLTLTASMLLRHGANVNHVNNVIKKIDENVTSFSSVVRRYLGRYAESEDSGEKCPECKPGILIREDGCLRCPECGYSKCG